MKRKGFVFLSVLFLVVSINVSAQQDTTKLWKEKDATKWYKKKKWLAGASMNPNTSIDVQTFAKQYQLNKNAWDKVFAFMRDSNLVTLPKGKYKVEGTDVTVSVTEDSSKVFEKTNWESHRKLIDVQCVIIGEEKMGVWPVKDATVTKAYDEKRDVANYSAEGKFYVGKASDFFIFFPGDAHRPNIAPDTPKPLKKVVFKVPMIYPEQSK